VAAPPEIVEFRVDDPTAVVTRMDEILQRGRGWINLQPAVSEQEAARAANSAGLFRLFSGRGPAAPFCSWVPGGRTRSGIDYVSLGIQHATGPKAVARLAESGVPVPETWHTMNDHPKRGLVVAVPTNVPNADVLAWLLRAAGALNQAETVGTWRAFVYAR
jgi:hypothetical protein